MIVNYVKEVFEKIEGMEGLFVVRMFILGLFFDNGEFKFEMRRKIFEIFVEMDNVEEIVIESRSEFVRYEVVKEFVEIVLDKYFEVVIGFEIVNDDVVDVFINKGNIFVDFVKVVEIIYKVGVKVKIYFFFKLIFFFECDGVEDVKESIIKVEFYMDIFFINIMDI